MTVLEGIACKDNQLCKFNKALYGLEQAQGVGWFQFFGKAFKVFLIPLLIVLIFSVEIFIQYFMLIILSLIPLIMKLCMSNFKHCL